MRLLLDECVDWRLARDLADFDVKTVRQMGWTGIENGALLRVAERDFDVFVTVDANLSFSRTFLDSRSPSWCSARDRCAWPICGRSYQS